MSTHSDSTLIIPDWSASNWIIRGCEWLAISGLVCLPQGRASFQCFTWLQHKTSPPCTAWLFYMPSIRLHHQAWCPTKLNTEKGQGGIDRNLLRMVTFEPKSVCFIKCSISPGDNMGCACGWVLHIKHSRVSWFARGDQPVTAHKHTADLKITGQADEVWSL